MNKFIHQASTPQQKRKKTKSPFRARENSFMNMPMETMELKKSVLQLQLHLLQQELQDKAGIHQLTKQIPT